MEHVIKSVAIGGVILSQVLDWHSTLAFLKSGLGVEKNSRLRPLQEKYGASKVMIIKGLLHLPICYGLWVAPTIVCVGALPFLAVYFNIIRKNYRIAKGYYVNKV